MIVLKLDEQFFAMLDEDEGWVYTEEMLSATPIEQDAMKEFLEEYKHQGQLTFGGTSFTEISVLELELVVKNEIKVKLKEK